jgi:ankyrin repeat protein
MATVSRGLPKHADLDVPEREARDLLDDWLERRPEALERIQHRHPKFNHAATAATVTGTFDLADAQLVIAREYGLPDWTALVQRITASSAAGALQTAIHAGDREAVLDILRAHPGMLHLPVWSANWGPPMSHAANLGRLEIMEVCAELGARDFQHAFDRAVLQGRIECARWLHERGAKLLPGIIMGSCETLNPDGFKFLLNLGAPLSDEHGNRLAPLALALETYSRRSPAKHEILELFATHGYELPDTPTMALHRGDISRLEAHLRRDPQLLERRFALREIYPAACGCSHEGRSGMHWTPIDGSTLLHLAIDFHEREMFEWLLARGADVNARATTDAEGFGGHTPLFHALVCGPWHDPAITHALLQRGALTDVRVNLRKFLDWRAEPGWHEARQVTAAEWARTFPEKNWVNTPALHLLENR